MNTTTFKDHLLQAGLSVTNQDSATARRFLTLALPLSPSKLVRGLVESALDNTNKGHLDMAEYHIAQALGEVAADNVIITAKAGEVKPVTAKLDDPYTPAQVINNCKLMVEQLAHYPVNLDKGPGWVRGILESIIEHGIEPDAKLMQERDGLLAALELAATQLCSDANHDARAIILAAIASAKGGQP